jgi:type VI protein secretion system component VasF
MNQLASALEAADESLRRQASQARRGSRSQCAAEWAGEIAARRRLGEALPTEAERLAFFRDRGVDP